MLNNNYTQNSELKECLDSFPYTTYIRIMELRTGSIDSPSQGKNKRGKCKSKGNGGQKLWHKERSKMECKGMVESCGIKEEKMREKAKWSKYVYKGIDNRKKIESKKKMWEIE
jgi:hypothetical protein